VNPRLASSDGRMIGSVASRWRMPNAANSATPAIRLATGTAVQPSVEPSIRP